MSITKQYVLSSNPFPEYVMPVDLSMYAQIASFAPRSSTDRHRLSPVSPTSSLSSSSSGGSLSSYSSGTSTLRKKKQVVFADSIGLNLVSIRIFTADPSEMETEDAARPEELVKPRTPMQNMRSRVKLGFPQPVPDNASLKRNFVQLESWRVKERVLSGTVRVFNIMLDKTVFVRITYDSWRSHRDIPCTYVREPYLSFQTALFAFKEYLPSDLDPKELLEFFVVFCVCPGDVKKQYVDNNEGKNFKICVENMAAEPRLVSPESRLAPLEPRLVSPESRLSPSEHRPATAESRLAPSEHRRAQSEAHRLAMESRAVTPSRRSFITPSPQRYSAWPAGRVLDQQRMKNITCRAPQDRLVNRNLRLTNVEVLC
ncbi:protein phosphatase 1 regulatory subunit 3C-B [Danio aesculapii]|uniref:protein phosphatase 1 regulatory subunit 3C-B n=1 Tax=Danio aesculapii TaxID=1142201 RepID=UPI0024BFECC9|nr:protein phosphatase 1 regulatory subunit 3C-B [Danio aesculapii]XP_056322668.1 protein phosphatase 1 regulatory subunit 3C-B [Danio aesculapii]